MSLKCATTSKKKKLKQLESGQCSCESSAEMPVDKEARVKEARVKEVRAKESRTKEARAKIRNFKKTRSAFLMTTRFNNSTLQENRTYLDAKEKIKCVYCSPYAVSKEVPLEGHMFVLEMNNERNRISGIGLARNHPYNYKFRVYQHKAYHRYTYVGHHHISRNAMTVEENILMKWLDRACFYGNRHLKRGSGVTQFPCDALMETPIDIVAKIKSMFSARARRT